MRERKKRKNRKIEEALLKQKKEQNLVAEVKRAGEHAERKAAVWS